MIKTISGINKNLISNIRIFDGFEGDNITNDKKYISINLTIQSNKTLNDIDLENINKLTLNSKLVLKLEI